MSISLLGRVSFFDCNVFGVVTSSTPLILSTFSKINIMFMAPFDVPQCNPINRGLENYVVLPPFSWKLSYIVSLELYLVILSIHYQYEVSNLKVEHVLRGMSLQSSVKIINCCCTYFNIKLALHFIYDYAHYNLTIKWSDYLFHTRQKTIIIFDWCLNIFNLSNIIKHDWRKLINTEFCFFLFVLDSLSNKNYVAYTFIHSFS